jgi:predicted nucleic acid-binding Zn ribbon protein
MRYSNSQSIKEVIENYVSAFKFSDKLTEVKIQECWENLMGLSIAKHTTKLEIRKNVLYILIDNASLKSELSFAKQRIADAINKSLGKKVIEEVVIL